MRSLLYDDSDSDEIVSLTQHPLDQLVDDLAESDDDIYEGKSDYAHVFELETSIFKAVSFINRVRSLTNQI